MKKLVLLFTVFLGLALFVYFYEIKGGEEREQAKELEESLFRVEEEDVTRVEVSRQDGSSIVLEKEGDDWFMKAPVETSVDRFAVDSLVGDVAGAKRERTLTETGDVEPFGLSEPRLVLKVEAGGEVSALRMGKEDFTGNQVYVQFEGQGDVLLTPKSIFTAADKTSFDFRDKNVLNFEQDEVQEVELSRDGEKIAIQKQASDWMIEEPLRDDADSSSVSDLLSSVKFARVEKFAAEQAEDLSEYGLEKPAYVLRLRTEGSDEWKSLQVGDETEGGYFAKSTGRSAVMVVKTSVVDKLSQDVWEFRGKKVVQLSQDRVQTFRIIRGEDEIVIERAGSDWLIAAPEAQKEKKTAAYEFWYPVTDVQFETISDEESGPSDKVFESPDVSVQLTTKEGETFHFDFVEQGETYHARRRESGKQGTISKEHYEKLDFNAEGIVTE